MDHERYMRRAVEIARDNPDAPFPGAVAQQRRLGTFCAAYGDPRLGPSEVVQAARAKLREVVAFIERRAAAGDAAQQAVLARGDAALYARDFAYLERLP